MKQIITNFDYEDTTPDTRSTPKFHTVRQDILREVNKLKRGESITYGLLSRRVRHVELLDYAIADLAAEKLVRWNRDAPMPTRIFKV